MKNLSALAPGPHHALRIEDAPVVRVGPGCVRRDLPSNPGVRVWVVEMEPGSLWPAVDQHDARGEEFYVIAGEVIEGDRKYPAGTYVTFAANSAHRPRTEIGVRLLGINLT